MARPVAVGYHGRAGGIGGGEGMKRTTTAKTRDTREADRLSPFRPAPDEAKDALARAYGAAIVGWLAQATPAPEDGDS